jgi:hypothetical protein
MAFYCEGITANHHWGEVIVNGRLDGFRGVPSFTETYQASIRMDSHPDNVSRITDSHSFDEIDLQELWFTCERILNKLDRMVAEYTPRRG